MSADKTTAKIGTILDGTEERDAIHVAVVPARVSKDARWAGAHVGLKRAASGELWTTKEKEAGEEGALGIIDPFLKSAPKTGDWVYVCLYPGTISSLRHHWEHPALAEESFVLLPPKTAVVASEEWLREFCNENDCPSYESVLEVVTAMLEGRSLPSEDYGGRYAIEERSEPHADDDEYEREYGRCGWLTFLGSDAHCSVPPEFWDHIEVVTGLKVPFPKRVKSFSCSC